MARVAAEQAHVVVVTVAQRRRLQLVAAHQPHSHVALHHLVQLLQRRLWPQLRAALDVLRALAEVVAGCSEHPQGLEVAPVRTGSGVVLVEPVSPCAPGCAARAGGGGQGGRVGGRR